MLTRFMKRSVAQAARRNNRATWSTSTRAAAQFSTATSREETTEQPEHDPNPFHKNIEDVDLMVNQYGHAYIKRELSDVKFDSGGQYFVDWEKEVQVAKDLKETGKPDERDGLMSLDNDKTPLLFFESEALPTVPGLVGGHNEWVKRNEEDNGDDIELPAEYADIDYEKLQTALKRADSQFFQPDIPVTCDELHFAPAKDELTVKRTKLEIKYRMQQQEEEAKAAHEEERFMEMLPADCTFTVDESIHNRVTKSGIEHSYKCLVVGGNGDGFAGFGIGRARSPADAAIKAKKNLRWNMLYVPRRNNDTLYHDVEGQHNQTKIKIWPRKPGNPLTPNACSPMMNQIFIAFGLRDCGAKVFGQRNPYSVIYAIWDAMSKQRSARMESMMRGQNFTQQFDPSFIRRRRADRKDVLQRNERIAEMMTKLEEERESEAKMYENDDTYDPEALRLLNFGYAAREDGVLDESVDRLSYLEEPLPEAKTSGNRNILQAFRKKAR